MYTKTYREVINFLAEQAPSVQDKPGGIIKWAEPLCELLEFIYAKDYDDVTADLSEAVREAQGVEDEDEDEE